MKGADVYKEAVSCLICPLCGADLSIAGEKSLVCAKGHCFDFSAKGYVNFIPNQRQTFTAYSKELYENRTRVFESGAYKRVLEEIQGILVSYFGEGRAVNLVDAGCGEGYFAAGLSKISGINVLAADISRDAIVAACRRKAPVKWMVADLTRLPVRSGTADAILSILSSANYTEFGRALKTGGLIVKVVPGRDYLKEIREGAGLAPKTKEYSGDGSAEYFVKHVNLIEKRAVYYRWPADAALFKNFTGMTPMTRGKITDMDCSGGTAHITIDLEILAGTLP